MINCSFLDHANFLYYLFPFGSVTYLSGFCKVFIILYISTFFNNILPMQFLHITPPFDF